MSLFGGGFKICTLCLRDLEPELVAFVEDALAAALDEVVEACCKQRHARAEVVEA